MRVPFVAIMFMAATLAWATDARADGGPGVHSKSVVVLDAQTGAEIFSKDADSVRAIASTTKIFVAMAVRRAGIKLEEYTEISRADAKASEGGSRTRLDVGQAFRNIDLLRAMLISSDNRAPTALGRAAGLSSSKLISEMNAIAKELGLKRTKFTDTSGLRGNVSTAREMALALRHALDDKVLYAIMHTSSATVKSRSGYLSIVYNSTNVPLRAGRFKVVGGKTGYTKAAGYCFITGAELGGRAVMVAILGAEGKTTRFTDFDEVAKWIEAGAPGSKLKVAKGKAVAKPKIKVSASGAVKAKK